MIDQAFLPITLGVRFLGGLAADQVGNLTRLPRVTILLLLGLLVGQSDLGVLPGAANKSFEPISIVALTMVAFLLEADADTR